jgi:hypothetical protein
MCRIYILLTRPASVPQTMPQYNATVVDRALQLLVMRERAPGVETARHRRMVVPPAVGADGLKSGYLHVPPQLILTSRDGAVDETVDQPQPRPTAHRSSSIAFVIRYWLHGRQSKGFLAPGLYLDSILPQSTAEPKQDRVLQSHPKSSAS